MKTFYCNGREHAQFPAVDFTAANHLLKQAGAKNAGIGPPFTNRMHDFLNGKTNELKLAKILLRIDTGLKQLTRGNLITPERAWGNRQHVLAQQICQCVQWCIAFHHDHRSCRLRWRRGTLPIDGCNATGTMTMFERNIVGTISNNEINGLFVRGARQPR